MGRVEAPAAGRPGPEEEVGRGKFAHGPYGVTAGPYQRIWVGGRSVPFSGPDVIRSRYAGVMAITHLLWDDSEQGNIAHIARHDVTVEEVEQVVFAAESKTFDLNNPTRPGRIIIFGTADNGRVLAVLLDTPTAQGHAYVVTARPATAKEGRLYLAEEGPE